MKVTPLFGHVFVVFPEGLRSTHRETWHVAFWQISLQKSVKNCRGLAANAGAARFLPLAPVGAAAATL
jgi:hypothetical protein